MFMKKQELLIAAAVAAAFAFMLGLILAGAIAPDHFRAKGPRVEERHLDAVGTLDDMMIGQEIAFRVDEKTRA